MVLGVDQHHFPDQHSVLYVDFEQAFLLDLLLLMANLISLTFLLILQLSHGGDCWAFISTCSADKILHGPATVKASYYLFVYWIVFQLLCRLLMVRARPVRWDHDDVVHAGLLPAWRDCPRNIQQAVAGALVVRASDVRSRHVDGAYWPICD